MIARRLRLPGPTLSFHLNVLAAAGLIEPHKNGRSILAEALMNKKGSLSFTAYSAGSHPKGAVHPAALRQLELAKLPVTGCGAHFNPVWASPVSQ